MVVYGSMPSKKPKRPTLALLAAGLVLAMPAAFIAYLVLR